MARRLNLGWLLPPKVPPDGVMSLADHLRELRYRVVLSTIVILIGMVVCGVFYKDVLGIMLQPLENARTRLAESHPELDLQPVMTGYIAPFMLALKVALVGGMVITSPIWLYQVWAYIRPALLAKEKKYALAFMVAAVPLFLAGVSVGYWVLPQGISLMLSFTPDLLPIQNLLDIDAFLDLLIKLMLVFGFGFLMPVIVVALNLVGVVSAQALKGARQYVIFGSFVFGAVATPGGDPFTMLALAIPLMLLFLIAEAICHVNDKRRARKLRAQGLELA